MKKLLLVFFAFALSLFVFSCVKENGFEDRVSGIVARQLEEYNVRIDSLAKVQTGLAAGIKSVKDEAADLMKKCSALSDSIDTVKVLLQREHSWTVSQLEGVGLRIDSIASAQKEFMAEVYDLLDKLELRIQKLEVIPGFSDGSVRMSSRDNVLCFAVHPDSAGARLAEAYSIDSTVVCFLAKETLTKSSVEFDTLEVKGVSFEGGILSVTVNGSKLKKGFIAGGRRYSGCLVVSDGNNESTSGFFPLYHHATDLSVAGAANCYIVSDSADYKIKAVKGNSTESVGVLADAEVLWESFGNDVKPHIGDLIYDVECSDGYVFFSTTGRKGNASIAVKDASGEILWSWHIWCADQPEEQQYNNGAGTMMDRNLGAIDSAKGSAGAIGLLYQWGRKDPFLGAMSILNAYLALSTLKWPAVKEGAQSLDFSIKNPTTFIKTGDDWCSGGTDSRWAGETKAIYDPCPEGWRVPQGGAIADGGVWSKAFASDEGWEDTGDTDMDYLDRGMDFAVTTKKLGSGTIWYPCAGVYRGEKFITNGGFYGYYWSLNKTYLYFGAMEIFPSTKYYPEVRPKETPDFGIAAGMSVRCAKEQ